MRFNKDLIGEMLGMEVESFSIKIEGDDFIINVLPKTSIKYIDVTFNVTKNGSEFK